MIAFNYRLLSSFFLLDSILPVLLGFSASDTFLWVIVFYNGRLTSFATSFLLLLLRSSFYAVLNALLLLFLALDWLNSSSLPASLLEEMLKKFGRR